MLDAPQASTDTSINALHIASSRPDTCAPWHSFLPKVQAQGDGRLAWPTHLGLTVVLSYLGDNNLLCYTCANRAHSEAEQACKSIDPELVKIVLGCLGGGPT